MCAYNFRAILPQADTSMNAHGHLTANTGILPLAKRVYAFNADLFQLQLSTVNSFNFIENLKFEIQKSTSTSIEVNSVGRISQS